MRTNPGTPQNKTRIIEFMHSTFLYRRRMMDKLDPTAVFAKLPRMVDTDQGRLVIPFSFLTISMYNLTDYLFLRFITTLC
jgi:hypothetical protein